MISIIIPIFNAEKYLERMLNSIINQSYKDYEVLMVDDGSTDKSAEICKKIAESDSRFKYYYQDNKGVSYARNTGLSKASGEYIGFVDADDKVDANYLDILLEGCELSDISVCDTVIETDNVEINRFTGDGIFTREEGLNALLCRKIINSGPCSKLYKRSLLEGITFPSMKTYEDIIFNLHAFKKANTVTVSSKTQYHYIENNGGAMSRMEKSPSLDIVTATNEIMRFIRNNRNLIDAECLYVTVSHLYQYVLGMAEKKCEYNKVFIDESKSLFNNYLVDIIKCKAVPWKEKLVFFCYVFGWIYTNGNWIYINNLR